MRHSYFGSKLSRTKNERRRLFMMQVRSLIGHGSVQTTIAKARAVQPIIEKLITLAKKGREADARNAYKVIADRVLVKQLFDDAKVRFGSRTGGFTRIVKLGKRMGDSSEQAMVSFVDGAVVSKETKPVVQSKVKKGRKSKKSQK